MISLYTGNPIGDNELLHAVAASIDGKTLKKVLILPPDYTRMYSGAGKITRMYYETITQRFPDCVIDIMPALGTHVPMTEEEWNAFFGPTVPFSRMIVHNWRTDVVKIGEVPASYVSEVSEGLVNQKIDVELNKHLLDKSYDLILSIGQVVPHEVVGLANYSKNLFVGCGGSNMINSSHMLGAFYGMERMMGRDKTPVRLVFDYAQEHFCAELPLLFVQTVTTNKGDETILHGVYFGSDRKPFEAAAALAQKTNMTHLDKPMQHVVVYLDPREFKSTWLGNKAIYRTRMAIADGGELTIIAPGVDKFGEDAENDRLIRKYGYCGREKVLELVKTEKDINDNLSVAAHLIHGSSDGRFHITYCTKLLNKEEVEGACFGYIPYAEIVKKYDPSKLTDGWHTIDGEDVFYISNPALGLWTVDKK